MFHDSPEAPATERPDERYAAFRVSFVTDVDARIYSRLDARRRRAPASASSMKQHLLVSNRNYRTSQYGLCAAIFETGQDVIGRQWQCALLFGIYADQVEIRVHLQLASTRGRRTRRVADRAPYRPRRETTRSPWFRRVDKDISA